MIALKLPPVAALVVSFQHRIKVAVMLAALAGMVILVDMLVSVAMPLHPTKA
jgi:hypothetical protein